MKKLAKLFIAGLVAFGLFFSFGLGIKANKQVQEVQTTGKSENPLATADQVLVNGKTPDKETGVTFDNGVLTITEDYISQEQIIIRVVTNGEKADLTVVYNKFIFNSYVYNQYGNLTIELQASSFQYQQVYASGNLILRGFGSVLCQNITGVLPLESTSPIYVGEKLIVEGDVMVNSSSGGTKPCSAICAKSVEINTNKGFNVSCNTSDPTIARHAAIVIHDCPNANALSERLTIKHGKVMLEKYFNEEDTQYNDNYGFVACASNSVGVILADKFDKDNKFFTGYPLSVTDKDLLVKTRNIDFEQNGGTGDFVRYDWYPIGSTITLPTCPYTAPEGQHFAGWALGSKTVTPLKQPGETFVLEEGDNPSSWKYEYYSVYAVWEDGTDELTGIVAISGSLKYGETLTASVTDTNNTGTLSYQWRRNGDDIASATDSTYVVTENDIGYTLSVKVSSSVETGFIVGTASGVITKADGPNAPTGISVTACTTEDNNDGVLKGVTTEMEYKLSALSGWVDGTGSDITGLVAGTYNVRVKETSTHKAGEIANVAINAYNAPTMYAVTVNKGTANPVIAVAGTTITITADPAEDGYVFDKWVSTSGVSFADASSEVTTFTMIEGNVTVTATYKLIPVPELYSITLSGTYKTEFEVGDTFSYDDLVVIAHYTNGGADKVVTGYVVSDPNMSTPGEKTITVTYTENEVAKTATYAINVSDKVVSPEPPVDQVTPTSNGLSGGAVAGIVVGSVLVAGIGGFALVWFVIKKKTWADFVAIFKKK